MTRSQTRRPASWAWRSKAESDDIRDSLSFNSQASHAGMPQGYLQRPLCAICQLRVHGYSARQKRDVFFIGAPHKEYRSLQIPKENLVSTCGISSTPRKNQEHSREFVGAIRFMKILVTGSAGLSRAIWFRNCSPRASRSSASITFPSTAAHRKELPEHPSYTFVRGDATDGKLLTPNWP